MSTIRARPPARSVGGPTPHPEPGPRPTPPPTSSSGPGALGDLGAAIQGALGGLLGGGMVLLGLALVAGGLTILIAQTSAGGDLARAGSRAIVAGGKTAIKAAVL